MTSTRLQDLHLLVARRRGVLLPGLDLPNQTGIEIGPLDAPMVRKSDGKVVYVDHVGTEQLRAKYAKYTDDVDLEQIVPIDIVWGDAPLPDLVGRQSIDYVIASHVAEHVPNLVGWLQDMQAVLKHDGQLRIILPDKRVSKDCIREETRIVDLLDAYVHQARKPQTQKILDCALYVAAEPFDPWKVYKGDTPISDVVPLHSCATALDIARDALLNDKYVDVHCWVFTPRCFANLMEKLVAYDLIRLRCAGFVDSYVDLFEFCVFLQPSDDKEAAIASWRHMHETVALDLPGSAAEESHRQEAQKSGDPEQLTADLNRLHSLIQMLAQESSHRRETHNAEQLAAELDRMRGQVESLTQEKQIILNSTIWRATAPLRLAGRAVPRSIRRWLHEFL